QCHPSLPPAALEDWVRAPQKTISRRVVPFGCMANPAHRPPNLGTIRRIKKSADRPKAMDSGARVQPFPRTAKESPRGGGLTVARAGIRVGALNALAVQLQARGRTMFPAPKK